MADVVLGMGEVGSVLFDLLMSRGCDCVGIDADPSRSRNYDIKKSASNVDILHVCIPGDIPEFVGVVHAEIKKYTDIGAVLIHSTVRPGTARKLQKLTTIPVISAPARGVHRRFLKDMQRYTKFLAADCDISDELRGHVEDRFKKVRWMSATTTVEYAKILTDTTYYGWLINYAQLTKMICDAEDIDYDEMWTFADEIHQILGNRPKMYPGVIGGHCVIPNLSLVDHPAIQDVHKINEIFRAHINRAHT